MGIPYKGKSLMQGNPLKGETPYTWKPIINRNPLERETPYNAKSLTRGGHPL